MGTIITSAEPPQPLTTRVAGWPRGRALVAIAVLLAVLAAAGWSAGHGPAPRLNTTTAEASDLDLYREIITRTRGGEPYYGAAAASLRENGYPLKPIFTFRLPVLHWLFARLGDRVMMGAQGLLALGIVAAWFWRLRDRMPLVPFAVAMMLLASGLVILLGPGASVFAETWAGMFLALMVGMWRPERWWPALIAGAAALSLRELALPMIAGMAMLALIERRWREAIGWAAVIAGFAVEMMLHAHAVAAVVRASDPSSQGWAQMLGVPFALKALASVTLVVLLPAAIAAMLLTLALAGWLSVRTEWGLRAAALMAGYVATVALLARADTSYWALLTAPLALMGLAFVPALLRDLAAALRAVPSPRP